MKKGFTLAEIMVVLTVIGILSSILLSASFHSSPNEKIIKFKNANNALYQAVNELVNNKKFYKDNDLGVKANEDFVRDGTDDALYFCQTLAEVLSAETVNCEAYGDQGKAATSSLLGAGGKYTPYDNVSAIKSNADSDCKSAQSSILKADKQIVTSDGVVWFESSSNTKFGDLNTGTDKRLFGDYKDDSGFDRMYKVFCIDVDGYAGEEEPFGYNIRVDGKIIPGARADEWVAKTIQQE